MKTLALGAPGELISVLCLGAHAGDIEAGAGGTLLSWLGSGARIDLHWCVLSATASHTAKAYDSAFTFMNGAMSKSVEVSTFSPNRFVRQRAQLEAWFLALTNRVQPDVIFTHRADDKSMDGRIVSELTRKYFQDHLVLEYEAPSRASASSQPNIYVPLHATHLERKVAILRHHFAKQAKRERVNPAALKRLSQQRGTEGHSPTSLGEAFCMRKSELGLTLAIS